MEQTHHEQEHYKESGDHGDGVKLRQHHEHDRYGQSHAHRGYDEQEKKAWTHEERGHHEGPTSKHDYRGKNYLVIGALRLADR